MFYHEGAALNELEEKTVEVTPLHMSFQPGRLLALRDNKLLFEYSDYDCLRNLQFPDHEWLAMDQAKLSMLYPAGGAGLWIPSARLSGGELVRFEYNLENGKYVSGLWIYGLGSAAPRRLKCFDAEPPIAFLETSNSDKIFLGEFVDARTIRVLLIDAKSDSSQLVIDKVGVSGKFMYVTETKTLINLVELRHGIGNCASNYEVTIIDKRLDDAIHIPFGNAALANLGILHLGNSVCSIYDKATGILILLDLGLSFSNEILRAGLPIEQNSVQIVAGVEVAERTYAFLTSGRALWLLGMPPKRGGRPDSVIFAKMDLKAKGESLVRKVNSNDSTNGQLAVDRESGILYIKFENLYVAKVNELLMRLAKGRKNE